MKSRKPNEQGWSNVQKGLAIRACAAVNVGDEQRKMMLSGPCFQNRAVHNGRVTSTAPTLNEQDFEFFMAGLERLAPGHKLLHFSPGYWQRKADDPDQRLRHRVTRVVAILETSLRSDDDRPLLEPDGSGLRGWIHRLTGGRTDAIEQLSRAELLHLINGLTDYARRHNADLTREPEPAPF